MDEIIFWALQCEVTEHNYLLVIKNCFIVNPIVFTNQIWIRFGVSKTATNFLNSNKHIKNFGSTKQHQNLLERLANFVNFFFENSDVVIESGNIKIKGFKLLKNILREVLMNKTKVCI